MILKGEKQLKDFFLENGSTEEEVENLYNFLRNTPRQEIGLIEKTNEPIIWEQ